MKMLKYHELMSPTLKVLEDLGGSGTNEEITDGVIQLLNLPEEATSHPHNPEKSSQTELEYRLAWARTYLKKYGLIDNSERGVWSFTDKYKRGSQIDTSEIIRVVQCSNRIKKPDLTCEEAKGIEPAKNWKESVHQTILNMTPDAFERLTKRLLRELGFVHVEVTGKSGDGGIDGKGIVKLQNILSYHIVFQCKRYRGSIGPGLIRDFRGAMIGRADKGLFITTGIFSAEAKKEANRDGASPIDLIDGDELADLLKQLKLGLHVKMVEEIEVDHQWFEKI